MIFSRELDLSGAKNPDEAIALIAQHIRYMQESLELHNTKQQKQTAAQQRKLPEP